MKKRFLKLIYIIALLGIVIFIPIYILSSIEFDKVVISSYKAKCLFNNEYVVLQGNQLYQPYVFDEIRLNDTTWSDIEKDLNFYCKYYNDIQPHIIAYTESRTRAEQVKANKEFWNFRENVISSVSSYPPLYKLEEVSKKTNLYFQIFAPIISGFVFALIMFVILQIIRMCYVYVVFGKVVWHPFKSLINK